MHYVRILTLLFPYIPLLSSGAAARLQLPLTSDYKTVVVQLLKQNSLTTPASWKDHMYLATKERQSRPNPSMQFSSFLIPGDTSQHPRSQHVLSRSYMPMDCGSVHQCCTLGWKIAPHYQHRT
jgi:hypothetical protein